MYPQPRPDTSAPRVRGRSDTAVLGVPAGTPAVVRSVAKAARILRCFDSSPTALTVRDIARRTSLPRSTCHALCSTLVAENMLELRPGGGYVLGPELIVMGGRVIERSGLADAAVPTMNGLASSTGSEIHLGQLADAWIVYLNRVGAAHRLAADNHFGLRVPAHATGCGRAALSRMDTDLARHLAVAGGITPGSVHRLLDDLRTARTRGFVVSTSFQSGLASVAAPITGRHGRVVGGLSVADRRETFTAHRVTTLGAAVRHAADSISRRLARGRSRVPRP